MDAKAENIIRQIAQKYDPLKIYLFGSYARNEQNIESDIDLLIIKDTNESFYQRLRSVRRIFEKQPLPMDIIVYTPDEVKRNEGKVNNIIAIALKEGIIVYEK